MSTDFSFHGHDSAHNVEVEAKYINTILEPEEIKSIVYVGVCCGYEAGILAGIYPHAVVHAIEAVRESYERYLTKDRCCCPMSVKTFNKTISNTNDEASLSMAAMNTQHSLLKPLDWKSVETRSVVCSTLEAHCRETGISPDMLVLDVEGVAGRVLIGAGPTILSTVKVVMCETEPAGANVFEDGDTDEFVDRILWVSGMVRVLLCNPSPPIRQLNSIWVRQTYL